MEALALFSILSACVVGGYLVSIPVRATLRAFNLV